MRNLTLGYGIAQLERGKLIKICPFESHSFFDWLVDDFYCSTTTPTKHLKAYEDNGFIHSKGFIVAWDGANYFHQNDDSIVSYLKDKIDKIRTGDSGLEFTTKMSMFTTYHDMDEEGAIYCPTHHLLFDLDNEEVRFNLVIDSIYPSTKNQTNDFKIVFFCSVIFEDELIDSVSFEIICYSPFGILKDFDKNPSSSLLGPHIVCNQFKIDEIKEFIHNTFQRIKAASINELLIKLSAFTDSFNMMQEELLSTVCSKGIKRKFHLVKDEDIY